MNEKRFSYCKFTIEEEKKIIEEYKQGSSLAAVGKKYIKSLWRTYTKLL